MLTLSFALFFSLSSPVLSYCHYVVQMEEVIARMQDEKNGIPIRTVKSFLTKIPSVFSGKALIFILSSALLFSSFPLLLSSTWLPPTKYPTRTPFLPNKTMKVFRELSILHFTPTVPECQEDHIGFSSCAI